MDQIAFIEQSVFQGFGPAAIYKKMLQANGGTLLKDPNPAISPRTVQRYVQKLRPPDSSGPWSFSDEVDPLDAQRVLEVLYLVHLETEGRVWLTNEIADWVSRLMETDPSMSPSWAYILALGYRASMAEKRSTRCLDWVLATRPWARVEGAEHLNLFDDEPLAWSFFEKGCEDEGWKTYRKTLEALAERQRLIAAEEDGEEDAD